jgi:DNA mismatch repair protein MutS
MTKLLEITPMMKQWQECKKVAKDALLLFQLGDFYECFFEDAKIIADILHITYTKRGDTPMAGIPIQSLENYLEKLIDAGLTVAIANQSKIDKEGKTTVTRSVNKILSKATFSVQKEGSSPDNNFLLSISILNQSHAIAYIDISTSEFFTSSFATSEKMVEEILRVKPKEILLCSKLSAKGPKFMEEILSQIDTKYIKIDPFYFDHKTSIERLQKLLKVSSLDGFGLKGEISSINACGALCCFLENDIFFNVGGIYSIQKRNTENHLSLDHNTLHHLEIFTSASGYSLFDVLNHTKTAMGARLLKNTLFYPLKEKTAIIKRQNSIKQLLNNRTDLSFALSGIKDIERLLAKIISSNPSPSDLILLAQSLEKIPLIIKDLKGSLSEYSSNFPELLIAQKILDTIKIDHSDYFIKENIEEKLDHLKSLEKESASHLKAYEEVCKQNLGIKSLKIGWSGPIGYFIEISKKSAHLIPPSFKRKQTLVNGERYITDELKQLETNILSAKEQALAIEQAILANLVDKCIHEQKEIFLAASLIGKIDLIHSLKIVASKNAFCCPEIVDDGGIDIERSSSYLIRFNERWDVYSQ